MTPGSTFVPSSSLCVLNEKVFLVVLLQALQYGSEDNASIIVVPLGAWGKQTSSVDVYSVSRNLVSSGRWA